MPLGSRSLPALGVEVAPQASTGEDLIALVPQRKRLRLGRLRVRPTIHTTPFSGFLKPKFRLQQVELARQPTNKHAHWVSSLGDWKNGIMVHFCQFYL
jgi:hypothetical protein